MRTILSLLCLVAAIAPGPAQQPKPEEPVFAIGKEVKAPRPISTPQPDLSREARKGKFNGVVVVTGYVGTDGKFHDGKVLHSIGDSALDGKVLATLKTWTFHPCTRDDKPVNCRMQIETKIHLE